MRARSRLDGDEFESAITGLRGGRRRDWRDVGLLKLELVVEEEEQDVAKLMDTPVSRGRHSGYG